MPFGSPVFHFTAGAKPLRQDNAPQPRISPRLSCRNSRLHASSPEIDALSPVCSAFSRQIRSHHLSCPRDERSCCARLPDSRQSRHDEFAGTPPHRQRHNTLTIGAGWLRIGDLRPARWSVTALRSVPVTRSFALQKTSLPRVLLTSRNRGAAAAGKNPEAAAP